MEPIPDITAQNETVKGTQERSEEWRARPEEKALLSALLSSHSVVENSSGKAEQLFQLAKHSFLEGESVSSLTQDYSLPRTTLLYCKR